MQLETTKEHSFKNFHAKGLQYICLERTALHTLKAYFFEEDVANLNEVDISVISTQWVKGRRK